jgi:hypothetical protein
MSYTSYNNAFDIYTEHIPRGGMTESKISLKKEDAFSLINGREGIHEALIKATESKFENFESPGNNTEGNTEGNTKPMTCNEIINHQQNCTYCKRFTETKSRFDIPPHVMKSLMYIITCIFVLFLLDIFVRIGSLLRK